MSDSWEAYASNEAFEIARRDPGFGAALALARCVNHLRFLTDTMVLVGDSPESPRVHRQQTSAILAVQAGLHDAIHLVRHHVGRFHRHLPAFAALSESLTDQRFRVLLERIAIVRNKYVAHFDPEEGLEALSEVQLQGDVVFSAGRGDNASEVHHRIADAAGIIRFLQPRAGDNAPSLGEGLTALLGSLVAEVTQKSDLLLGQYLKTLGFQHRPGAS